MSNDDFEFEGRLTETVSRRNSNPNLVIGAVAVGAAAVFIGLVAYTSNARKPKKPPESSESFNTARMEPGLGFERPATKEENKMVLPPATPVTPPVAQTPIIVPADQGPVDDSAAREAAEREKLRKEEEARRLARLRSPMIVVDARDAQAAAAENGSVRVQGGPNEEPDENRRFQQTVSREEVEVAKARQNTRTDALVPQGTFIRASLETAIQSDLPGMVRAITTEDVYSFDGRRVLIPKGTMLTGEYRSAIARGQTRVFVIWTRLLRADGVSLNLGSGGSDDLGRAGMAGEVDNHYFERFGSAILLTLVGGVTQAAGSISQFLNGSNNYGNTLVFNPITGQLAPTFNNNGQMLQYGAQIGAQTMARSLTQLAQEALRDSIGIKPTIHIDQGEKVIVFVKRDLDFSSLYPDPVKEALYELRHGAYGTKGRARYPVEPPPALPPASSGTYSRMVTKP